MQRSIDGGECPQRVIRAGKRSGGIERRNVRNFSDSSRECSGEEIAFGGIEGAHAAVVGRQGPRVVGFATTEGDRGAWAGVCTAGWSGEIDIEEVVTAQQQASAKIAGKGTRMNDGQGSFQLPSSD